MDERYEHKVVKAPMNNPRARQRLLNRHAEDGWEVVETTRGPLFSRMDHVTLRRAVRASDRPLVEVVRDQGPHRHEWVESGSSDGVKTFECSCGESRTLAH